MDKFKLLYLVLFLAGPAVFTKADTDGTVFGPAAGPSLPAAGPSLLATGDAVETGSLPAAGLSLQDFTASALWTGSWDFSGNLIDRGDFRLGALGLIARAQVIDKRPGFFKEALTGNGPGWETGDTAFSGGLYHNQTGSRLLYGILEEWGLPARLRNPWGKAVPFADAHRSMAADLRTTPSASAQPEAYLYLGSPALVPFSWNASFRPYATVQLDEAANPSFGAGLETRLPGKTSLRAEGFYTGKVLAPRAASAWFSESPPLPERETRLYGLGVFFTRPFFSVAADGAYSETFAWGQGLYGNLAVRLGNKPWELNLGVTGAESRFVDRAGAEVGAAFRMAGRFEWKWQRTSFIRGGVDIRAPQPGENFDRGTLSVYYRFPSNLKTGGPLPFRPVRVSAEISRDARDLGKILDKAETGLGFNLGPFGLSLLGSVSGIAEAGEPPLPFPAPASWEFESAGVSLTISYPVSILTFKAKAGYTALNKKAPIWDGYISAAIRAKPGRFSVKLSASDFPQKWDCTLSWRLELAAKYKR
jgi:hypothetical protein